jgi:hypothetical protein
MPLDSGLHRNDEKGGRLKFVSPAKAGVQSMGFKWPDPQIDNVYLIMESLVTLPFLTGFTISGRIFQSQTLGHGLINHLSTQ